MLFRETPNNITYIIVACLLIFTFSIAVLSIREDSVTMDEVAHLPSGYSYLTQKDMRLNPEHPPLVKDLAAIPLLFIKDINFPYNIKDWKDDVNGQWGFGYYFLYHTDNPADDMIFWARIPMILISVILGLYVFLWTKELFGNKAGLLALFLYSFSPTILAHSRLVTTDVGAAAGIFIAVYYFVKFLKNNSNKNLVIAGVALAIAELLKFSAILLFPFFGLLILIWAIINSSDFKTFIKNFGFWLGKYILILIICFLVIWALYQYHTWNYPPERQVRDSDFILSSFGSRIPANAVVWMADKPVLRPLGQYFLGVLMILQRSAGGNTTYFWGEISASGWKSYFPLVYLLKEPLAFHILLLGYIIFLVYLLKKLIWPPDVWNKIKNWSKNHFGELSSLIFIAIYWTTSVSSNLNIGVRHLLPVFPLTIMLVAGCAISLSVRPPYSNSKIKKAFLGLLVLWQAFSVISVYPHFLSYFNELAGGPENGYKYTVDSNLDWGQDLKRLAKWTDENNIDKIYVDYFGGGDVKYYLGDKFLSWQGAKNPKEMPNNSYLAVSATFLQGGRGKPAPGFNQPYGYYLWLNKYEPVVKIGNSIFVYHIVK